MVCFFNDTATTGISTLSLHDALPISGLGDQPAGGVPDAALLVGPPSGHLGRAGLEQAPARRGQRADQHLQLHRRRPRSEEHTSELQSRQYLVCRLLLEKKRTTSPHMA